MLLMWLKSNFILWNVQNDNKVEQHKDMITSYQSEKYFQNNKFMAVTDITSPSPKKI